MTVTPEDFRIFRNQREAELVEPYGWLTLRGFHWLATEPSSLPDLPGSWWADESQHEAHLRAGMADGLTCDGTPVDGAVTASAAEYSRVPWVHFGDLQVELLRRGGRLAVRTRAATSIDRERFAGVPLFAYDSAWRIRARFRSYPDPPAITVGTIRPDLRQVNHPIGEVTFTAGGEAQRLAVTKGKYGWGVVFHDPTNGDTTEQWRQLHFDPPADGSDEVVLDFNRSLNMWFAFTDHATCPAPIPGNVVTAAVTAGEHRWRTAAAVS